MMAYSKTNLVIKPTLKSREQFRVLLDQADYINERVGVLLRQERALKGRSIRTVARKMKIKRSTLKRWELGLSSPPANKFYSLICFYGKEAYRRASELDLQLQFEKYDRELMRVQSMQKFKKVPAVIWAEDVRFQVAA
jgi:transcriptional regulator with XRE-family HTH domain